ncbi:MAG: cytochrome c biogenesis protein CcsA [Thermoleophilia bacterium]
MSWTTDRARMRLIVLGVATAALTAAAILGSFLVAPEDSDQGLKQRIFYFHVPIALVSLLAFGVACVAGILGLRAREHHRRVGWDDVQVASVTIGMVFSVLTIITGSIWAKASWGTWWVWDDPRLVTYLVLVLLYAAYFVLRSSAEGDRQMRYGAVYAIFAFAAVPLSFWSVRVAKSAVHPVVITRNGAAMPHSMLWWFLVSLAAMTGVFATVLQLQLIQRRAERTMSDLKMRLERLVSA